MEGTEGGEKNQAHSRGRDRGMSGSPGCVAHGKRVAANRDIRG